MNANGPVVDLFERLDDTRFNLLAIGQSFDGTLGQGDLLRTHVIRDDPVNQREFARVPIAGPAFYLLRPDGHIGLAGSRLDVAAVTRYLTERHIRCESTTRMPVSLTEPVSLGV